MNNETTQLVFRREEVLTAALENLERLGGKERFLNEILLIAKERLKERGCKDTSFIIKAIDQETTNKAKEFLNSMFENADKTIVISRKNIAQ